MTKNSVLIWLIATVVAVTLGALLGYVTERDPLPGALFGAVAMVIVFVSEARYKRSSRKG